MSFDGVNDNVDVPNLSYLGDRTIEGWFQIDSNEGSWTPLYMGKCTTVMINGFETLNVSVYPNCNGTNSRYFNDNIQLSNLTDQWHHLAVVIDGNQVRTYVNGIEVSTDNLALDNGVNGTASGGIAYNQTANIYTGFRLNSFKISNTVEYNSDFSPAAF